MPASAKWSFTLLWLFIISALIAAAYETYDETDRQAEESAQYEDDEPEETTTTANTNYTLEETTTQSSNKLVEVTTEKEENEDLLQKILPKVKFNCKGKSEGYYADSDFCELFHYCKTNGFRFTFICPPKSYYNEKLMACEYNSTTTLKDCEKLGKRSVSDQRNKSNETENIHSSTGEQIEIYQPFESQIHTISEKPKPTSTNTESYTTVTADPYLTRRRTPFGSRIKQDESAPSNKSLSPNEPINKNKISDISLNKNNVTILPFRGFSKTNLRQNTRQNQTDQASKNPIKSEYHPKLSLQSYASLINTSIKASSSARPVINFVGNELQKNSSQSSFPHSSISNYKPNAYITTTALPNLLAPTIKVATTISLRPTPLSFESSSPSKIYNPENSTQSKANLSEVDYNQNHSNPDHSVINQQIPDQMNPYQSQNQNRPQLQQIKYSKLLSETPQRQTPIYDNPNNNYFGLPQTSSNSGFLPHIPQQLIGQDFPGYNFFNRQPLFDEFENQQTEDADNFRTPTLNNGNLPNLRLHPSASSQIKPKQSLSEMIEALTRLNIQQMNAENSEISLHRVMAPKEMKDQIDKSSSDVNDNTKSDQILTIPLLVPAGLSKTDLKRGMSGSLLKPTAIPLAKNGQQFPAYVLQLENSKRTYKSKQTNSRLKRQILQFNSPYLENPFLQNPQYLPMLSDNNLYNYFGSGLSLNEFEGQTPIGIGDKPDLSLNPSAQQNIPYYTPFRHMNTPPNNFIPNLDENIFDLNQFSDIPAVRNIPFNRNPMQLIQDQQNDLAQYRAVSLKRPSFKRPPRREKVPEINLNKDEKSSSTKTYSNFRTNQASNVEKITQTTASPVTSLPVRPIVGTSRPQVTNPPQFLSNINPFSQISNANIGNIGDAIKYFDSSDDSFLPLSPSVFDSQSLFQFNSPNTQSNSAPSQTTQNIVRNGQPVASALVERPTKSNVYSGQAINTYSSSPNYLSQSFPPLPQFGDPDFRLPQINIPDPTLRNIVFPQRITDNQQNMANRGVNHGNKAKENGTSVNSGENIQIEPSVTPINYYQPDVSYDFRRDNERNNGSQNNKNHNYDKEDLQAARTHDISQNLQPISNPRLNWNPIITRHYDGPNITVAKSVSYSTKVEIDKNNQNDGSNNSTNQRPASYGYRLKAIESNKSPTFSVKASVRSVSSMSSEPTNQVVISKKSGSVVVATKQVNDSVENDKNDDHLYNHRVNAHSDRLTLLNYYNDLNANKQLIKHSDTLERLSVPKSSITTTMSPTTLSPPLTTHWSIRGWKEHSHPPSSKFTTTPPTTTSPSTTESLNTDFEIIDLYESEALRISTTTQSPQTTEEPQTTTLRTESAYRKVFNSFQGSSFQSNRNQKPQLFALKSRPDLSLYLSSITSTAKSI